MILPLSTLLGSNYFQLRIFAVSDKTSLSNNPCWLSLPSTGPVLHRTPVNFLHPQHLTSICCLLYDEPPPFTCCGPVSDYFPLILLVCGLDEKVNRQSPPTPPVSSGFCRPLLNCPDLFYFFFSRLKLPNPFGCSLYRSCSRPDIALVLLWTFPSCIPSSLHFCSYVVTLSM